MSFYDDYFPEPSEFDEKCEELKNYLRSEVKKEIQEELERLRKENEELKDIKRNWDDKVAELNKEKSKYKWNEFVLRDKLETEFRNKKLSELLSDFSSTLYIVWNQPIMQAKCNNCDENRLRHYITPLGREATEKCTCARQINHYIVKEAKCKEFKVDIGNNPYKGKLIGWYTYHVDEYGDENYELVTYVDDKIYKNESFGTIKNPQSVYFYEKEKAQEYADWLNNRK